MSLVPVTEADFGQRYISREGRLYQDETSQIKERVNETVGKEEETKVSEAK